MSKFLKIILVINLLVLDCLVGYLIYKSQISSLKPQIISNNQITNNPEVKAEDFQELAERVGNLEMTPYPTPAVSIGQIKTVIQPVPTKSLIKSVSYVNIPGSGETNVTAWTDIVGTDFYFDKAEYPGLTSMTVEASIKLYNGNGIGYVRLWDATHGFAVVGSDINTSAQSDTLVSSGTMNLWSGKNLYRVQARSNSSDRLIYSWGKLKIVTQN